MAQTELQKPEVLYKSKGEPGEMHKHDAISDLHLVAVDRTIASGDCPEDSDVSTLETPESGRLGLKIALTPCGAPVTN